MFQTIRLNAMQVCYWDNWYL